MITPEKHGLTKTTEYNSWRGMIERCENENHRGYNDYGGRGIKVCQRWRNSFSTFLSDMGPKPDRSYTIERRKNHEGYAPGNCFWASRKVQARNKRNNRLITAHGVTRTLAEWSEMTGVSFSTIVTRIDRNGLSAEEALKPGKRAKKNTRWIEHAGERMSLSDWARRLGMSVTGLSDRIEQLGEKAALTAVKREPVHWIEYGGERLSVTVWAERLGISPCALRGRIARWGIEWALTTPKKTASCPRRRV